MQEEAVVSAVYRGLGGDIALLGGSAGDNTRFGQTFVYVDGTFQSNVVVMAVVHTSHPVVAFRTQHFEGGDEKLVVTGADSGRRTVTEINGELAAPEYARIVGLRQDQLTPLISRSIRCSCVWVALTTRELSRK